jgi:putative tryptophan/tyrosine transport system substrate-binding protein
VDRREFLGTVSLSLLAAPLAVEAQQTGKVFRIGVLSPGLPQGSSVEMAALRTGLREVGYVEGQNIRIDWQFAEGSPQRLHELAAELVRLKPDVIFTININTPAAAAAKSATRTIPIVFVRVGDPIGAGLVRAWRGREGT